MRYRLTLRRLTGEIIAQQVVENAKDADALKASWLDPKLNIIGGTDLDLIVFTMETNTGWEVQESIFMQK